jgi:hypothetical protein
MLSWQLPVCLADDFCPGERFQNFEVSGFGYLHGKTVAVTKADVITLTILAAPRTATILDPLVAAKSLTAPGFRSSTDTTSVISGEVFALLSLATFLQPAEDGRALNGSFGITDWNYDRAGSWTVQADSGELNGSASDEGGISARERRTRVADDAVDVSNYV